MAGEAPPERDQTIALDESFPGGTPSSGPLSLGPLGEGRTAACVGTNGTGSEGAHRYRARFRQPKMRTVPDESPEAAISPPELLEKPGKHS